MVQFSESDQKTQSIYKNEKRVQKLESAATRQIIVYVQQQLPRCSGVVLLKNLFNQERTGHRSIEALHTYERLNEVQHKAFF
jgi:hypothetical protein